MGDHVGGRELGVVEPQRGEDVLVRPDGVPGVARHREGVQAVFRIASVRFALKEISSGLWVPSMIAP